jgi:branched-subunit amino acid transport protein
MNFTGIIVGLATFLIIGLFHPIVIKAEYYLGTKCWWMFLVAGIVFCVLSIVVENLIASTILGVTAFSSFWTIGELFEQKQRVKKGWFPEGPGHEK